MVEIILTPNNRACLVTVLKKLFFVLKNMKNTTNTKNMFSLYFLNCFLSSKIRRTRKR